jgi:acetate kinase
MAKILVINCGSSSLKYEVYEMPEKKSLGKGLVERIGEGVGIISQESLKGKHSEETPIPDHRKAMELVRKALTDSKAGIIASMDEIAAAGHRVVHGGEFYAESVIIDDKVLETVDKCSELAPLHNPPNITGIRETVNLLGKKPQVAVFDTAFHQTLPPAAYLYGIPRELYEKYRIRRYGFHGTSHRYVAAEVLNMLKRSEENTSVISCHLGNGASVTAVRHGKSVDTSMGFTPLEGLVMGTRSGDIDPAVLLYLLKRGYDEPKLDKLLNKQSGMLGLSGVSNDMRDIEKAAAEGNKNAQEALDVYAYRIRKYIGAYAANLPKTDAVVFTGGIGQNSVSTRAKICEGLEGIGIILDPKKNEAVGRKAGIISADYSPAAIAVVITNEELQIAIDTYNLAFKK